MPGKRPYRLGKRQASVDETKRRIIAAAAEEYQINGIEDTSMQAVARRAEVAPGTVLYHYPTPDDLAGAVVESWIAEMRMPTPESIDPGAALKERLSTLVEELYGLYERSEVAYRVYSKSGHHPVMARADQMWQKNVGEMLGRALADRADEPHALQVVAALVNPGFRGTLMMSGLSAKESVEVATELAVVWLSRR
jgi:AcrR family transcriptional regulator